FLVPGTYEISVESPDGTEADPVEIELDRGEDVDEVDFELVAASGSCGGGPAPEPPRDRPGRSALDGRTPSARRRRGRGAARPEVRSWEHDGSHRRGDRATRPRRGAAALRPARVAAPGPDDRLRPAHGLRPGRGERPRAGRLRARL